MWSSNTGARSGLCWPVWLVLLAPAVAPHAEGRLGVSCHIHPPTTVPVPSGVPVPVGTLGPFRDQTGCEAARARLFGGDGRCHCVPGFDRPRPAPRERDSPAPLLP